MDQVIVFEVAGVRDAGLYGAVYRIYERIQFLPAAIMTTLFPLFVAARDHDPDARPAPLPHRRRLPAADLAAGAGDHARRRRRRSPACCSATDFVDAAPALPLLMATFVVVSLGYLTGYLIVAYNLQRRFLLIAIGALVFNVATNLALVPSYGFMAAAWLTLATEVLVMSLSMWIVCSRMGVSPVGDDLGRIVARRDGGTGLLAWGLREAGLPTAGLGGRRGRPLRGARDRASARSGSSELRALVRREEA